MSDTLASYVPVATSAARFTVSVLDSDFAEITLGALTGVDGSRVKVSSGDISTHVAGDITDVIQYLADVLAAAGHRGVHVSATIMLAYVQPPGQSDRHLVPLTPVGLRARAHWTAPTDDHGATAAIQLARDLGTWSGEEPFVTRLDGDLATVLETVAHGVVLTSQATATTTSHVTIALNTPSPDASTVRS